MEYQNVGSPHHQREETFRIAKCLESALFVCLFVFVVTLRVLIRLLPCNFNLNNFNNTVRHWLL